eukprot:EG_transcript_54599
MRRQETGSTFTSKFWLKDPKPADSNAQCSQHPFACNREYLKDPPRGSSRLAVENLPLAGSPPKGRSWVRGQAKPGWHLKTGNWFHLFSCLFLSFANAVIPRRLKPFFLTISPLMPF